MACADVPLKWKNGPVDQGLCTTRCQPVLEDFHCHHVSGYANLVHGCTPYIMYHSRALIVHYSVCVVQA